MRLPTRQDGVENRDNVYRLLLRAVRRKFTGWNCRTSTCRKKQWHSGRLGIDIDIVLSALPSQEG